METVNFPGLSGKTAFVRPLTVGDVDACVRVESTFPEPERCSEEKFKYRLTVSPELCLGLFINEEGHDELIGHVIATRITSDRVTDDSMEMPQDWDGSRKVVKADDGLVIGNDANGSGIGVHGLVIVAEHQKKGLGRSLLNKYIEYLRNLDQKAECVAIIAHDHLLQFYESVGFINLGPSPCNFGGGGWYDMVLEL
ncbi:acyl-CoA N-acyltransferase [Emericellopsis atlantica]|uniref:Acyl-CoA N-acyltransferase n=1 Tax=Emericellopsis atlantica TaxID=2614577 RepID=A0A9P7ZQ06_9HYPO|nr:acyl-CoA N-acyltransferase [Emericellopsis atlantica]KAG9256204.1 acyl-CoA N-acyltransferase [Emericellopsis atlantica]